MKTSTPAVEALRNKLRGMTRTEALDIADTTGLSRSTLEKFRLGHITEPRAKKVVLLSAALAKVKPKRVIKTA